MLILKIIIYLLAFVAATGQYFLNYVIKDRESISYKKTRTCLFIILFASLIASIGLLVKEDMRAEDLSNQVNGLRVLMVSKDNNAITREQKAQEDRNKLLHEIDSLNIKIEPFINLAKQKYPHEDTDNALKYLITELKEVKELVRPNIIKFQKYDVIRKGNDYIVKFRFNPEKNIPLGLLIFYAAIDPISESKILNIWPNTEGGAFQSGKDSKFIMPDGKSARLVYSLLGAGLPTIDITVSKLVPIKVWGNNGLDPFIIKPIIN